jgi:hypothetical protein
MESIFLVGEPKTVVLPRVLPRRFEVFKGRERLPLTRGERFLTPPPERTEVEMGSRVALAKELPKGEK